VQRELLEKCQVLVYLVAIAVGLLVGALLPGQVGILEGLLWPVLGVLLYATFTQVPLTHLRDAFRDPRFIAAAVVGNFLVLPLVVWGLVSLAPADPAIRLGILLVLLVPCTDWFITFTHLGGGDTRRAIVFSPVSLLLQMALLPLYLWLFLDAEVAVSMVRRELLLAFSGFILLPLLAAWLTEKAVDNGRLGHSVINGLGWLPVPLLAVVVFAIAGSQVGVVMDSLDMLRGLLLIFVLFLVMALLLARGLARLFGLPAAQGRVLAFSFGSRNSFVVLPLALALPATFELAVVVIVFQSLVELAGMAIYVWCVPKKLFPMPR